MTVALIVTAVVVVLWGGLALLIARGRREHRTAEAEVARLRALPTSEARRVALELLRAGEGWQVRRAGGLPPMPLPVAVAELLAEFEEIVRGEFWIGRSALEQPARIHGCLRIGGDVEFGELMVRPTGAEVLTSYEDGEQSELPDRSPSVWHRILEAAEARV